MKCTITTILIYFSFTCIAQKSKPLLPLHFEQFDDKKGLSNNIVKHIFCDSRGLMWFGTADGLNMYDGLSFRIYRHSIIDTVSVAGNDISDIAEDKNNNLWVGTLCSGLSMLNPFNRKCSNYFAEANMSSLTSNCDLYSVFDKKNNLWVSNRSALSLLNKDGKTFQHFFPFSAKENNFIYHIAIDSNAIWLSHKSGIKKFDITTKEFTGYENLVESNTCGRIVVLSNEKILVNTWEHGIYIVDIVTKKSNHLLNHTICNDAAIVSIADRKQLWVGTSQGLYVADIGNDILFLTDKDFCLYKHDNADPYSINGNYINCIYYDTLKDKSVWIGTDKGVNCLNPVYVQFTASMVTKGVTPYTTTSLFNVFIEKVNNGNSNYWLSYWHGTGLLKTSVDFKIKNQIIVKDENKNSTIVSNAIRGKDGYLWMATWDGLWCYDDKHNKLVRSYKKDGPGKIRLTTNNLDYVLQDKKGRFWIGTYNRDLNMINMDDSSVHVFHAGQGAHSLIDNRNDFLFEDSKGRIWVTGTALQLYNEATNNFTVYTSKRGDSTSLPGTVSSLFEDHTGKLWIATNGGLAWFDEEKKIFHNYTVKEGLPNDDCLAIAEDQQHNLWITTSGGLCCINTNNFIFRSYTVNDGLPSNQLGQCIFNDEKGRIIFTINEGNSPFISFDPIALLKNKRVISFQFISVNILGEEQFFEKPIEQIKALHLSYKQNLFSVFFKALDYQNVSATRYQCRLQGFDKTWIDIGHQNNVTYTNLDGGTYILKVKAANASGEWLDKELQLTIIIDPPFWKTWWFYLSSVLLVFAIVYIIFNNRVKKIRKVEEQKTAIANEVARLEMKALKAQMNPHFVFNSLSSIQESIVSGKTEAAAKYLGKFSKLIRLVLQFSDVKLISLQQEINYLLLYLELESFRFENFHFNISVTEYINNDFAKIPPMLIQPFVENAIKHGLSHKQGEKNVTIHFKEINDSFVQVVISDNGIGRQQAALINESRTLPHQSMGMKITGDRLELMQQKNMQLLSVLDKTDDQGIPSGTEVTILIPLETIA